MDHSRTRIFSFPNSLYPISQSIIILEPAESEKSVCNESIVLFSASRSEEDAQGPKTPRRIRNQDYNHVISVEIRSGYGPGTEVGGKKNKVFSLKSQYLKNAF